MHPATIVNSLLARLGLRRAPIALTYEVTGLCNLSCAYCDRRSPLRGEMTRSRLFGALEGLFALGMTHADLDGGEPLAHPHIQEIVDWLAQREVTIGLRTNGLLVPGRLPTVRRLSRLVVGLDGPRLCNDGMRGAGSFDAAMEAARAARAEGVRVEFSCAVGRHNAASLEPLLDAAEGLGVPVVFHPALSSLASDPLRDGSRWELDSRALRSAFARIEELKRRGRAVGNEWTSIWRLRTCPDEHRRACSEGRILVTMDPEGVLFPCGEANRADRTNSVPRLGADAALANLALTRCGRCWSSRLVDGAPVPVSGFQNRLQEGMPWLR